MVAKKKGAQKKREEIKGRKLFIVTDSILRHFLFNRSDELLFFELDRLFNMADYRPFRAFFPIESLPINFASLLKQ